ncbi:hypothetical protein, partial [Pyrobaculum sp.]|uniref:hypothetical protein n=1 Tax=Pyrobaculum sp. TaxID=2004705 RepID=UPI003D1127AE
RGIMLRQGVGVYTAPHVVVGRDMSPQEEQVFAAYSAICRDMSMKQCIDELWRRLSEKTALVYDVKPVARDIVFAVQVDRSKFLSLMFSKAQLDAQLIINAIQLAERLSRNYRAMQTVLRFLERSQAARLTPLILLIVLGFVALLVLPQLLPALQQAFGHILPAPR